MVATGDCRAHHGRPFRPGYRVHRDRRDCRCSSCHGYVHPNRPGHCRPSRDSGEPGSRLVVTAGNNAVPVDKPSAGGNTAALAGNSVPEVRNTGAVTCSNRHSSSKARHRSNTAQGTCTPRNCSSCLLHRHRARTHRETIPLQLSEEFDGAFFEGAWRPPGPRVSHTSDAGERQSIIR